MTFINRKSKIKLVNIRYKTLIILMFSELLLSSRKNMS